ncbi:hypothetical protein [Photorhabdus akhurstii]|uniref:hypothetical protein n=1 Tax=Photorhabdus akhurstii TaxID=171438 RepID=UPI002022E88C|nr:hypothetical protein [Photorhabdus akhurstii]
MGRLLQQLLHPALAQRVNQFLQLCLYNIRGTAFRKKAADGLSDTIFLRPDAVTHLPQVDRRLPAQLLGLFLQHPQSLIHQHRLRALVFGQRPDNTIERPVTAQATQRHQLSDIQFSLQTAAPEQQRAITFLPIRRGQPRRDGFHLLHFAHHQ